MHKPVLLNEVLEGLKPMPGEKFIDATANGGGHALAIWGRIKPDGKILAIEWDAEIYQKLKNKVGELNLGGNFLLDNGSYTKLSEIADRHGLAVCHGILFDLGFSSWQVDESGRGFSFQKDEPLDMRFNQKDNHLTAAEVVNTYDFSRLSEVIRNFGGERLAGRISKAIIEARKKTRIITSGQLVEIIGQAVPANYKKQKINFATRTFQALRIEVNHELGNIKIGLEEALKAVAPGGRIAVISFHSLEDKIVKDFFRRKQEEGGLELVNKKPITAGREEILENNRSRSAKLRIIQKSFK